MKINEITESFDSNVPGTLVRATSGLFTSKAIINGRIILVNAVKLDDNYWDLDFSEKTQRGITFAKTGSGGEMQVFSFVINSIKELISRYAPDGLVFTSDKSDGNRSGLYQKMLKRVKIPGYEYEDGDTRSGNSLGNTVDQFVIRKVQQ